MKRIDSLTAASLVPGVEPGLTPAVVLPGPGSRGPALDPFARDAGPDVTLGPPELPVRVHAVFAIDPKTQDVRVSVVDETGRLVRVIPPDSVAQMLAAMAAYSGR